jgi:hypothetical protein
MDGLRCVVALPSSSHKCESHHSRWIETTGILFWPLSAHRSGPPGLIGRAVSMGFFEVIHPLVMGCLSFLIIFTFLFFKKKLQFVIYF